MTDGVCFRSLGDLELCVTRGSGFGFLGSAVTSLIYAVNWMSVGRGTMFLTVR